MKNLKSGHGGRRPGAGAKKGSIQKRTLEKRELAKILHERFAAEFNSFVDAYFGKSRGVYHMMARDRDGTWTRVTDPDAMQRVLNSGETFYRIHAQDPDARALKDLFDRHLGLPVQAVETTHDGVLELRWKS